MEKPDRECTNFIVIEYEVFNPSFEVAVLALLSLLTLVSNLHMAKHGKAKFLAQW